MPFRIVICLCSAAPLVSCQIARKNEPYAPPARPATVESVEVITREFHGRPEAYAKIRGTLSTSMAQLVDPKQSRDGNLLYLEVLEQTPRASGLIAEVTESPKFEKIISLELLGLLPGKYILNTNGIESELEIPALRATTFSGELPGYQTVDEFIPIEDSAFVDSQYADDAVPVTGQTQTIPVGN
ncbi:MAG: hypothetical protein ABF384_17465 [Verrucomicrobiales bacterium]